MSHHNAPLTVVGRQILCSRIEGGRPVSHVAKEMGLSRTTAHKWWNRYKELGATGLTDRSSRPLHSPRQTPSSVIAKIVNLRTKKKRGPLHIAAHMGIPCSTVHKILVREHLNVLTWIDRPTGATIRRYEKDTPGELIHLDIKKLGRIPRGGGHKVHGRVGHGSTRVGYDHIHVALDDHSRLTYAEVFPNEKTATVITFFEHAQVFFAEHGITIQRTMTDNGPAYRSAAFASHLESSGILHSYTKPYRPQTNGKVERFNRTLAEEWAYVRPYTTNAARTRSLNGYLHRYNYHRVHSALGGKSPIDRVNNLCGHYI